MLKRIVIVALFAVAALAATQAGAGPRDAAISVNRIGGDSAAAQPYIEKFLRYLETAAGWPAGSSNGAFLVTRKEAAAYIAASAPGFGMMDPPLYFELRKSSRLTPILQVEDKDLHSDRLHVVVKNPAYKTIADLKGKRLWTTLADYPTYLSKVVLGGQVDAASHFDLRQIGQALKGVRSVLRGDCEATVLDDEQLAKAREITGGKDLRSIHTSPSLPPVPLVVFGDALSAPDRAALAKALTAMCGTDKGGAICREMHIVKFVPANQAIYDETAKRFGD